MNVVDIAAPTNNSIEATTKALARPEEAVSFVGILEHVPRFFLKRFPSVKAKSFSFN